ncbi:hypothetical protein K438DRAFT_1767916 [Mycena galopus ATCC 62051]|nr:hypothetical protein K438DRAFT_1767916 [Mycena galopus ATCC 62051]
MPRLMFRLDLISLQYFLDLHQDSHFATRSSLVYWKAVEFEGSPMTIHHSNLVVEDDIHSAFHYRPYQEDCTFLIRNSTGQFCADFISNHGKYYLYLDLGAKQTVSQLGLEALGAPNMEVAVMNSLTLDQYHAACCWKLAQHRSISISASEPVTLGTVYSRSSESDWVEIASMPDLELDPEVYHSYLPDWLKPKEVMENGWTRLIVGDAVDLTSDLRWMHRLRRRGPAKCHREVRKRASWPGVGTARSISLSRTLAGSRQPQMQLTSCGVTLDMQEHYKSLLNCLKVVIHEESYVDFI